MPLKWEHFKKRLPEIENRKTDVMMDISLYEENGVYTQFICVEMEGESQIPSDMKRITIPEKNYLYHLHNGKRENIANTFGAMYDYAKFNGLSAGKMKIDKGYTVEGKELEHHLYIELPWT